MLDNAIAPAATAGASQFGAHVTPFTGLSLTPTQLLAAEAAHLSFGTYRRHLAAGLEELSASLWLRRAGNE